MYSVALRSLRSQVLSVYGEGNTVQKKAMKQPAATVARRYGASSYKG